VKAAELSIFDYCTEPVLITDPQAGFVYANQAFSQTFEVSLKRLRKGKPLQEIFPQDSATLIGAQSQKGIWQSFTITTMDGRLVPLQICVEETAIDQGIGIVYFLHDLSLEQQLQQKYKLELGKKEQVIAQLDRRLFELSFLLEVSNCLSQPGASQDIVQLTLNLAAKHFSLVRAFFVQEFDGKRKLVAQLGDFSADFDWQREVTAANSKKWSKIQSSSGETAKGVLLVEAAATLFDQDLTLLQTVSQQILGKLERELLYSDSITDQKTGVYNVRFWQATLAKEFDRAKRRDELFGLIVVDIDHFKKFNDTYGHQTGDEVLIHVAKLVQKSVRQSDTVARFGGEEFCVLAIGLDRVGLTAVMERIRQDIEKTKLPTSEHGALSVTVSVGGALLTKTMTSTEELFAKADEALYAAKGQGRNRSILSA